MNRAGERLIWGLGLGIYAALALGPVTVVGLSALNQAARHTLPWLALAIPSARTARLLLNSIALAGGTALLSTLLGWVGAVALWGRAKQERWALIWLVFSLAAIPPAFHVFPWLQVSAGLQDLLGNAVLTGPLRGWIDCLWVEISAYTPFVLGISYLGLSTLDPELIEAGRTSHYDFKILLWIALPLSAPAWVVGGGMVFLMSLLDYSVPSLLQVHTYAMEIFAEYSASGSPERAFLVALPLLVVGVGSMAALLSPLRSLVLRAAQGGRPWGTHPNWPIWFQRLSWAVLFGLFLYQAALLAMLGITSGGVPQILDSLQTARGEFVTSGAIAFTAVLLSSLPAWLVARLIARSRGVAVLVWGVALAPLAIPASLVGVGLLRLQSISNFHPAWLASIAPAMACLSRFAPVMVLVLCAQMRRSDTLLGEVALVYQPNWLKRGLMVHLPLAGPALLLSAALVFALSLGELAATLMVAVPGQATLIMRIYGYLHYGASDRVAGLCLWLSACILAAALLAALALNMRKRLAIHQEVA